MNEQTDEALLIAILDSLAHRYMGTSKVASALNDLIIIARDKSLLNRLSDLAGEIIDQD